MALPRTLAFLALSVFSLAAARAHTVEGWYAGAAIGLIGASGTKEDACLICSPRNSPAPGEGNQIGETGKPNLPTFW